jgi:hypothetical protein
MSIRIVVLWLMGIRLPGRVLARWLGWSSIVYVSYHIAAITLISDSIYFGGIFGRGKECTNFGKLQAKAGKQRSPSRS